ncbi:hypothetical protein F5Y18DRAFT_262666 [Xylariaceae sp. FL1019]|nr:hypothetical protein F5Y18DRAFT_262666 [Xylariaceae sp. FL1019]
MHKPYEMDLSSPDSPTGPLNPYPDIPIQSPNAPDLTSKVPSNIPPAHSSLPPNRHRIRQPYSTYSESSMLAAMEAITTTGLSLRKASQKYSVPKTTLAERLGDRRPRHQPINKDPNRPTVTRYAYSEADVQSALEEVRQGVNVGEAAKKYGVPSSSLGARVKGRTPKVLRGGERASKLTLAEESTLAEWAGALGRLGFPPGKDEVFALAELLRSRVVRGG